MSSVLITKVIEVDGMQFTFTMPSIRQRIEIGKLEAKMRGDFPSDQLDDVSRSLMYQLAYLNSVVSTPDGFSFDDQVDPFVMNHVYKECLDFEATFLEQRELERESSDL